MEQTFISNKYDTETILKVGQKVECSYYHEYGRWYMKDAYKRKWWQLLDRPFKPVKLGIIVGDAGIHRYWLAGTNREEQYLLVKFKEYFFAKPIPISCIMDAKESAKSMSRFLRESACMIGEKGYETESFKELEKLMNKAKLF